MLLFLLYPKYVIKLSVYNLGCYNLFFNSFDKLKISKNVIGPFHELIIIDLRFLGLG